MFFSDGTEYLVEFMEIWELWTEMQGLCVIVGSMVK